LTPPERSGRQKAEHRGRPCPAHQGSTGRHDSNSVAVACASCLLSVEAPTQPVTRPSGSVATMLTDNYMGGSSSHWRSAPLGRTVDTLLFEPYKRVRILAAVIGCADSS